MNAFNISKIDEIHQLLGKILSLSSPKTIKKDYDICKTINPEICSECGGQCCKRCGCHFSPNDFKEISFEFLRKEIEKGYISLDYVDGELFYENSNIFILRIRNQDTPIVDIDSKRTPCILLTENGCKLDYEHRPTGGKLLIPSDKLLGKNNHRTCQQLYSIEACCAEWKPYQKLLHSLATYFQDKDFHCSL